MAEQKKGGFHALEQRIHQMEEEDAKQAEARRTTREHEAGAERTEPHEGSGRMGAPPRK